MIRQIANVSYICLVLFRNCGNRIAEWILAREARAANDKNEPVIENSDW